MSGCAPCCTRSSVTYGICPVLIERGRDVDSRRLDIAAISREKKINPVSNYCFGEGGAGAYSDGKLFTRSKKRGNVEEVLQLLVQHGAHPDIRDTYRRNIRLFPPPASHNYIPREEDTFRDQIQNDTEGGR